MKIKSDAEYLIIDDDRGMLNFIVDVFKSVNILSVEAFSDPVEGWQRSNDKKFDFLIIDWKMTPLNGTSLINRFRSSESYRNVPILVVSGYLNKSDMSVLEEFYLIGKLEKPFDTKKIVSKISELQGSEDRLEKEKIELSQVLEKCSIDPQKLLIELARIVSSSPEAIQTGIEISHRMHLRGEIDIACQVLNYLVKKYPSSVRVLSELGKLLLRMGKISKAKKLLLKAQRHSPNNIERLCDLGNVHLQENKPEIADKYFEKALAIDQDHHEAKGGKELSDGIKEYMRDQDEMPKTFASMLNAIGISMAKSGQFESAKHHYENAMNFVSDASIKSKLAFNLGLCFDRWEKPKEANNWFQKAIDFDPNMDKANRKLDKEVVKSDDLDESILSVFESIDPDQQTIRIQKEKKNEPSDQEIQNNDRGDTFGHQYRLKEEAEDRKSAIGSQTAQKIRDRLERECPVISDLFARYLKQGIHVESQLIKLNMLLSRYKKDIFSQAIENALEKDTIGVAEISFIIENISNAS